jgi:NAD(P)-dependent dehydrogenase (short-subunit alcohol dehydrogenase family)
MKGKTCLVTGANSGIGLETARGLAKQGARVIMVCRDEQKGEAARQDIMASTGNDQVDLLIADLSSLAEVRQLAEQVKNQYDQLHVLIHNAGLMSKRRSVSADGYELQFAVHHLATFLLTELLLDLLKASAPARIINVASMMHKLGKINFDDLQCEQKFGTYSAYGQSKLAMIHYTYDLAEKLEGSGVTVNALHPGAVATNIGFPGWMNMFLATPEKGARTTLFLATSQEVEGLNGKYFNNCKVAKTSKSSYKREDGKRLWEITKQMCAS